MIFFINLLYSIIICYLYGRYYKNKAISDTALFVLFLHFGLIWLIILGGQYYVGTDYPTYIKLFNGNNIEYYQGKGEYLFYWVVVLCNEIGIKGQALYFIFYSVNIFILYLILKRFKIEHGFIFILLYIAYSNVFNNQLNYLRQSLAIHLSTLAYLVYSEGKTRKSIVLLICGFLFHVSTLVMLVMYLYKYFKLINHNVLRFLLILSFVGSFLITNSIFGFLSEWLPPSYESHLAKENDGSIMTAITKYIFIPLFWLSTNLVKKGVLSEFEKKLFYMGFLGFCIKLMLLRLPVINRLSDYFILISIFPIFFYLRSLFSTKKELMFTVCIVFFIMFYALKTVFMPKAEYLYNSIYI